MVTLRLVSKCKPYNDFVVVEIFPRFNWGDLPLIRRLAFGGLSELYYLSRREGTGEIRRELFPVKVITTSQEAAPP